MNIEKITLNNLTAIEGEQVIDFTAEPLRSAALFAITGDTGSGKSTILDAICLALYNKAPRFEGTERSGKVDASSDAADTPALQAGNVCNLLRRGRKSGSCAVVFSNERGERYEATWSVKVTSGGKFSSPKRTLTMLAPRKEQFDKCDLAEAVERAVGLNYAQFTRTVLLAQNSFANFLRAKQADKAVLLEKLTGTELYGAIGRHIFEGNRDAAEELARLESERRGVLHDRMEPLQLQEEEERERLLSSRLEMSRERQTLLERQTDWMNRFQETAAMVTQHETQYAEATKACVARRKEELELERYDAVADMQPLYREITMRQKDIQSFKEKETDATKQLVLAEQNLKTLATRRDVLHERTTDAERQLQIRQPAIDRGHTLTGEISAARTQLEKAETQLTAAKANLEKRHNALAAKTEQLETVRKEMENRKLHKQSLSVHRLMYEKFDLIKDKLSLLYSESMRNAESHKKQAELQRRRQDLKERIEKAEKNRHENEGRLNALKSELLIHRQSNSGRDSAQLQQRAASGKNKLDALKRAAVIWKHISEGYAALDEKQALCKREENELTRHLQRRDRLTLELKAGEEAFSHISTAYTLSSSENIVRLRRQLKEGTACPVCGGTHHPYHTETEQHLGELLNNLSKDYETMREKVEKQRADLAAAGEDIAASRARLESEHRAWEELKRRQEADVAEWQDCIHLDPSFADCSPTVNRDARRMTIELLLAGISRESEEAARELETFNFHQQQINGLNEQIASLDDVMDREDTLLSKLRTEDKIAKASLEDLQQIIHISDRSCSQLYTDLDEMITLSGWFTEWKNNADGLRLRLTRLHEDWMHTCAAIDEAVRSETILSEEIKNIRQGVTEEESHVTACRESRDGVREEIHRKEEELQHLFGDGNPQSEATRLTAAIENARTEEHHAATECEKAQTSKDLWAGRCENLRTAHSDARERLQQLRRELDTLILRFNGDHTPLSFSELDNLFTDSRDWKVLRNELKKLREEKLLAESRLARSRKMLSDLQAENVCPFETMPHHLDEAFRSTASSLEAELKKTREESALTETQLAACRNRLMLHRTCVERAEKMEGELKKAEENAHEWERLNTLFGSADGKKLRTLAQSHTFHRLVMHANRHLETLAPRYELYNRPGTLLLEVIDRYMLDTHRHVSSLSGGETFVVSLALALALASLSAGTFHIGSLFIDEGFGNLDRESLELVMTTLSNLETTQGRKVGVISHTEQIRQQIAPQIRLVPRPGGAGSSLIEVR